MPLSVAALLLAAAPAGAAESGELARPMYYLQAFGSRAQSILPLTWGLLILAIAVVVIICVLLLIAVFTRRSRAGHAPEGDIPLGRGESGLPWIYGGLVLTSIILAGYVVWTMTTMVAISKPANTADFHIEVVGHQWWWEVRYVSDDPSRIFETANEIHIPVGLSVPVVLKSADVIHSFWVPALSGKTDLIPGRTNETWIEANKAGVYRGQCAEYCGKQHAHMAMKLFADSPRDFQDWWDHQLEGAPAPQTASAKAGHDQFLLQCGVCHTVRGTPAGGRVGPELTHLMNRTTIAANTLPNTKANLSAWIADPQHIKPGNKMPRLDMSGPQLSAIRDYLVTLQ